MPRYRKKIQVLVTEKQYKDLQEIAAQQKKKLGTLVREAIEEYHLKKKKKREVAEAVDRLLSLPELPGPEDYQQREEEYLKSKYSCKCAHSRDTIHAATMIANGIKKIISTDPHFDLIPEIKRIVPRDYSK